jgi:hypothetical protein
LERAAYEAERAARHSRLLEPEPRLVARQLAQEWEDALLAQRQLQEDYGRFVQAQPPLLSQAERAAIEQLAQNLPALWHAPTTTMAARTEIVQQIMQRVIVAGEGRSARLQITIEWVGGGRTAGLSTRPISHLAHLRDYPRLCERIRTLVQEGYTITQITAVLAHEGFRSSNHLRPFSRQSVIELRRRLGVQQQRRHRRPPLQEHEWWLSDLEREVGKSNSTLHQWRKRGGSTPAGMIRASGGWHGRLQPSYSASNSAVPCRLAR